MPRYVDKGVAFVTVGSGICNQCRHVSRVGISCKAFPRNIPAAILTGEHDHRKPYPGDNGIRFQPIETERG